MSRRIQPMWAMLPVLALAWVPLGGCSPPAGDGDGDADTDVDADGDGDGDASCPADWECCTNPECSNGVFCDGIEVCDRGVCELGFPIDCNDDLACTDDQCDEQANLCVHLPVHQDCDDGNLCNGSERCEPADEEADEAGCLAGMPMVCDDGDDCTEDYCEANECLVRIRDGDGDGHADRNCALCDEEGECERGDDCDDADETIFPGAAEICDDGKDNNCDRDRDYADATCAVPNDGCAAAIGLTHDLVVHSSTRGTTGDIDSGCSPAGDQDVAFTFTTTAVQDVDIYVEAFGGRDLTVALTAECGNASADIRCTTGRDFTQINRALVAGTYYVVVSAAGEVDFDIRMRHGDPAARPDGDQCATATDVSAGGTFPGTTVGFDPDYDASCGEVTDRDAVFVLTLTETAAMDLSVEAPGEILAVSVQSSCGIPSSEVACFEGDPAAGWVRHLAPGTHYIIVKTTDEATFDLSVDLMPTSADSCADALDASAPGTYRGSTLDMTADIDTSCGDSGGPDSAYMFTLTAERDVYVDFTSLGEDTTLSLTAACGDPGAELRCSTGDVFQLRGRGLAAGTYYLVTTGDAGADYEFDIDVVAPVPRPDEDLCTGAIDVTGGGHFSGSTADCENDYDSRCGSADDVDVAYSFTLAAEQSVDISATADTGAVTVALQRSCGVLGTERACFTANPTADRHYRSLEAGTYFLIFKTPVADTFTFDLSFGPPEPGVPLNFIALPWDFFQWDEPSAGVLHRAVSYGYPAEPVVGIVRECTDTSGSTSSLSPGGSSAGEFNATIAALVHAGMDATSIIELADEPAAETALGTYDVLLFPEFETFSSGCAAPPSAMAWVDTVSAHIAAGGRVVSMGINSNITFINDLALFGTGSSGSSSSPYTTVAHDFWDVGTDMPTSSLNATTGWHWTSGYLVPLAHRTSVVDDLLVFGCDIP